MLLDKGGIKVLDGIKLDNQLTLKCKIILDYLGGLNIITRVLIKRIRQSKSQREDVMTMEVEIEVIWGHPSENVGSFLEAEKD